MFNRRTRLVFYIMECAQLLLMNRSRGHAICPRMIYGGMLIRTLMSSAWSQTMFVIFPP